MQTQTQPNGYHVRYLPNGEYSLFDDNGQVKPLLIDKEQVTAFDVFDVYPNGTIAAKYKGKWYIFTADLTPIALEIEVALRLAFDYFYMSDKGKIVVKYKGKFYGFNADLTPIALQIEGEPRVAFDYFGIDKNGIIEVRYGLNEYFFNPDGTPALLSITLPQSISIPLTEEKKLLWDFMLAGAQMKLKKLLTPEEFLSLLMESYQKTTLDDVDEKPEKAFFANAKTERKIMQRVLDGGGQAFEKVARDALSAGKESKPPYNVCVEVKQPVQNTYCSSVVFRAHDSSVFRAQENPLDTLGLYTCGLRTCLICKIKRKEEMDLRNRHRSCRLCEIKRKQRTEVFLRRVAEHTEMIERIRKKREEYTTFKPMPITQIRTGRDFYELPLEDITRHQMFARAIQKADFTKEEIDSIRNGFKK